jgi:prolyl-tRNA editing enzyme YbaK/EbsC (Cys-tRNA(Pro) deacylase)
MPEPGATWPEAVERVASFLRSHGVDSRLEEFAGGTPTADAAAEAAGCHPSQIVKSLVFVCGRQPGLAFVPGDRRADPAKVARAAEAESARVARPDEVIAVTGFEPGAVAPFPLPAVARILLERLLMRHDVVWAGAGSPRHMVRIAPGELARLTKAEITDIAEA